MWRIIALLQDYTTVCSGLVGGWCVQQYKMVIYPGAL